MKSLSIRENYFFIIGMTKPIIFIYIFCFLKNLVSANSNSVYFGAKFRHCENVENFHCINDNYVTSCWFCDGVNDCGDLSDESYGCDPKCGYGNFTCGDETCLPIAIRCNGIPDCADGSDEKFCDHEPQLADCNINKGKFLCKDKLQCIDLGYVFDGKRHCFDGSDETERCIEHDPVVCNSCFHACLRTPDGPHCFFNHTSKSFEEATNDIGRCKHSENHCDQKCITFKGRYQCSCEENFLYKYTFFNNLICVEKDIDKNVLLYVTSKGIKGIRGYRNQSTLIMSYYENITAISAANEFVYWGGLHNDTPVIGKISLQGGNKKIIITEGIEEISAVDVDWRTGNIYFIDNKRKHIAACNENGSKCIEIIKISCFATSLGLAPRYGIMFWSTFKEEDGSTIRTSNLNGGSAYTVISDGLRHVTSIAVDEASEKIYWLDTVRRRIEVALFFENERKVFKSDLRMKYLAISINANYLYWILANDGIIQYSPGMSLILSVAYRESDPINLLYGYSYSEKTTKMSQPCDGKCDGICLLTTDYDNRTRSYCVCTNKTAMNGKWCPKYAQHDFSFIKYHKIPDQSSNTKTVIFFVIVIIICAVGVTAYFQRRRLFTTFDIIRFTQL